MGRLKAQADDAAAAGPARPAVALGVVGVAWIAAHISGLLGPLTELTFVLLGLAALVTCVVGVRRHRPSIRWPWYTMTAAVLVFLVGGAVRQAVGSFGDLTESRSLLPDFIVIPGYAIVVASITGFVRARWRGRGRDIDALLDSAVASLGVLAIAWTYLLLPALSREDAPLDVRLSLAAFPPLSVFIAALCARVAFTAGVRMSIAQRSLLAGMLFMVAGDILSTLGDAHLLAVPQRVADGPYALAFLALGVTVLHPSMRELTEPVLSSDAAPSRGRLVVVTAALGVPALVTLARVDADWQERAVLVAIILSLTAAVALRIFRALREQALAQAHLAFQATHDQLTGLPNRAYLLEHLDRALRGARVTGTPLAVLFLDVDRFKLVNDTGGHSLGDELLVSIAQRLEGRLRSTDVVARIGGDEFVVVVGEVSSLGDAVSTAERLLLSFQSPFRLRGSDVYSSASMGLVFVDPAGGDQDAEGIIGDADTAMYQAKAAGRDGVAVFDPSMRDRVAERLVLEQDLRSALEDGELQLHFQPIVRLADESVDGLEALLRWVHPTRGLISPATVIPIAEETGLIVEIGAWVLDEAVREVKRWRRSPGGEHLYVSVNLSARQLRDPRLAERVATTLSAHRVEPSALCLELTESVLMGDPASATETLHRLRELGVRLSLDDFGTGYSSLSYLKRFPVHEVKIDRSFVEGLDAPDCSEASLVAAIVAMARALDMQTVAEGVELPAQAERLRELGADQVQGYLYARPVGADAVLATLARLGAKRYAALPDSA